MFGREYICQSCGGIRNRRRNIFDLQAFILNSPDQIREVESREIYAEEQLNVRKTNWFKKRKNTMFLVVFFMMNMMISLLEKQRKVGTSIRLKKEYLLQAVLFDC